MSLRWWCSRRARPETDRQPSSKKRVELIQGALHSPSALLTVIMTSNLCASSERSHWPPSDGRSREGCPWRGGGGPLPHLLPVADRSAHEDRLQQHHRAASCRSRHSKTRHMAPSSLDCDVSSTRCINLSCTFPAPSDLQHHVLVVVRAVPSPRGAGIAPGWGVERAGGSKHPGSKGCGPHASPEGHSQRSAEV